MKEPVFPKLDKHYLGEARVRAEFRKSQFDLLLIPFALGAFSLFAFVQFRILWFVHVRIYPDHSVQLDDFVMNEIGGSSSWPSLLMVLPIGISSLILGMILANFILWCIPAIRRILENKAEGIPFASFRESMTGLTYIALILTPICLLLGLIGAWALKSIK